MNLESNLLTDDKSTRSTILLHVYRCRAELLPALKKKFVITRLVLGI
jgi:hypothetical protein